MSEPFAPPPPGPPAAGPPYGPPTAPPPPGGPLVPGGGLPWEQAKTGNTFIETMKQLVTDPTGAYARAREKGDYASPVIFALIVGTIGVIFQQVWSLVFGTAWVAMLPPEFRDQAGTFFAAEGVGSVLFALVLGPVFVLIGLFIGSAIVHLFLLLFGGTKESTAGFEGTVRSLGYAGVANLAYVVPFVGAAIAIVWGVVMQVIGLKRMHHTTTGKAVAAILVPWLVCCVCIIIFVVAMGASIAAMLGNQ
jgi:hypothetical protein